MRCVAWEIWLQAIPALFPQARLIRMWGAPVVNVGKCGADILSFKYLVMISFTDEFPIVAGGGRKE